MYLAVLQTDKSVEGVELAQDCFWIGVTDNLRHVGKLGETTCVPQLLYQGLGELVANLLCRSSSILNVVVRATPSGSE